MGFKLPGKSIQSGTSAHSSALKMVAEQKAASALKQIGKKGLYASDMSWKEGTEKAKSEGNDLNALVKQRKGLKKGSYEYNKVQNKINSALGNKTRYDEGPKDPPKVVESNKVTKLKDEQVVEDKKIVDEGETKMAKEGPKQTNEDGEKVYGAALDATADLNKNELKYTKKIQRQKVKDARKEFGRGSDEVKAAKATKKDEVKKTRKMVKTNKKDQKFVDRDESLDRRITKRKEKGKSTAKLEGKKAKNKQKEKEFGESLG